MLADPCADPRIFARVVQARLPENSSNNVFVFFFVLNFYSFTVAYQWFISKKSIILLGFGGGGSLSPLWIRACDHLTTRN